MIESEEMRKHIVAEGADPIASTPEEYAANIVRDPASGTTTLMYSDGVVVGRIMKAMAAPVGEPWLWRLAFVHHEDRTPTHGYATTREEAMAASARSWRRE